MRRQRGGTRWIPWPRLRALPRVPCQAAFVGVWRDGVRDGGCESANGSQKREGDLDRSAEDEMSDKTS